MDRTSPTEYCFSEDGCFIVTAENTGLDWYWAPRQVALYWNSPADIQSGWCSAN